MTTAMRLRLLCDWLRWVAAYARAARETYNFKSDAPPPIQIDGNSGAASGKLPIKIGAGTTQRFERRDSQLQRMENFA